MLPTMDAVSAFSTVRRFVNVDCSISWLPVSFVFPHSMRMLAAVTRVLLRIDPGDSTCQSEKVTNTLLVVSYPVSVSSHETAAVPRTS